MINSAVWIASDLHFGHDKIVALGHRPANFAEIETQNIKDAGMRRGDVFLNLGDAYLYKPGEEMLLSLLRWTSEQGISTVLVRGNHDSSRMGRLMRMGWSWVCDSTSLEYHGKKLLFTHEPVEREFAEDLNVHGHLHQIEGHRGGLIRDGKHVLVSMELLQYRPIPLDVIVRLGATPAHVSGKFVVAEGANAASVNEPDHHRFGNAQESQEAR